VSSFHRNMCAQIYIFCAVIHADFHPLLFDFGADVYGEFESYKGGIYRRAAHDASPEGGHAVKAVGWGVGPEKDAAGTEIPYLCFTASVASVV
jgi:hypothetical protein